MPEVVGPAFRGVGYCSVCHNRKEIVAGGKCENCMKKDGFSVSPRYEVNSAIPPAPAPMPNGRSRKEELLDHIISHATEHHIENVYAKHFSELRAKEAWIDLLEKEPRERVLLRLAVELGWSAKPEPPIIEVKQDPPETQTISESSLDLEIEVPDGFYLRKGKLVKRPVRKKKPKTKGIKQKALKLPLT